MPGLTRSRNPVLEAPPTAPPNGRSLPVRWAVAAALSAAIAGVVWILVARPPAQGLYRIIYWLHDHTGLPVYAHLWRTTQPFSLAWLLPAGVLAGLGLIGWLTNRSLLRAIQRRVLIRAVRRYLPRFVGCRRAGAASFLRRAYWITWPNKRRKRCARR